MVKFFNLNRVGCLKRTLFNIFDSECFVYISGIRFKKILELSTPQKSKIIYTKNVSSSILHIQKIQDNVSTGL